MVDRFDISRALRGFGAGVAGRGEEFLQGLDKQRKDALIQDSFQVQQQLKAGDISGARNLLINRLELINRLGGDPADTQGVVDKLDQGDVAGALTDVSTVVNFAQAQGLLPGIAEQQKLGLTERQVEAQERGLDIEEAGQKAGISQKDKQINIQREELALKREGLKVKLAEALQKSNLGFKDIQGLQKDVTSLIGDTVMIKDAASRLEKIGKTKSATDQLAAIFTFMKSLDPTSVVREGEQDQARATGGLSDQLIGFVDKIRGEGALPANVFNQMINTAKRLSNQAVSDSRDQVLKFVDTFGEKIDTRTRNKTLARVPTLFEIKDQPITPPPPSEDFKGFVIKGVR